MANAPTTVEERGAVPHWYAPDGDVLSLAEGSGARVTDEEGREYLDFVSQLYCVNAGHDETRIVDAMTQQARSIPYVSSAKDTPARRDLAARLREVSPGDLTTAFFSISGSEANELAAHVAREYTGRQKVLTRWRSYHGGTYGAASFTGDPETRAPVEKYAATTGAGKFLPPLSRAFDADSPAELADRAADHLEFVVKNEGPDSVAAVLMEPVGGTSGGYPAPPGYFERVREICDEYGILLVADEVITGFGRCGDWFGMDTEGVVPDVLTFAKGVTSAYAPLAGVLARPGIADHFRTAGMDLGQTFAGHPVSCAAGVAALDVYEDGLIDNCASLAPYLEERLRDLERYDVVSDVRGRGFLWGVEFTDPETGEPFVDPRVDGDGDNPVDAVVKTARERGVLVGGGRPNFQLTVAPPLCVDRDDVDEAVEALDAAVAEAF